MDGRAWKRTIIFPNSFFTGSWIVGLARGLAHVLPTWMFPGKRVPFSRPFIDTRAGLLKWSTRADCKSAALGLRRFESFTQHRNLAFASFVLQRTCTRMLLTGKLFWWRKVKGAKESSDKQDESDGFSENAVLWD